jgi:tetratricopeptide (TPR) repeat protein
LDKAIFHLRKSLLNEGNPEYANYYMAIAFEKKKEFDEASHFYKEALTAGISQNCGQYHKGMARMFAHANKYKEVIFHYKESLPYEDDGYAYFYMANAAEQYYKDKSIAIDYYQKFVTYKGINKELEVIANQRIKALKEQAFMRKK